MRPSFDRRSATKVVDGKARAKNRKTPTALRGVVFDRESPGKGFRQVVTKRELQDFLDLLPDWAALSDRLERIVLGAGSGDADGYHEFYSREGTGAIYLHAWECDLWTTIPADYFKSHEAILERLGVSSDINGDAVLCRFTEAQARAFTLLHVLLHELGHHQDHLSQRGRSSTSGEDYAETFANERFQVMYPAYVERFGDPAREA